MNNTNPQALTNFSRLALARHALTPTSHAQMVDFEEVHTMESTPRSTTFVATASSTRTVQHAVATATRGSPERASRQMAETSAVYLQKTGNN
jgi:hypothetical protein